MDTGLQDEGIPHLEGNGAVVLGGAVENVLQMGAVGDGIPGVGQFGEPSVRQQYARLQGFKDGQGFLAAIVCGRAILHTAIPLGHESFSLFDDASTKVGRKCDVCTLPT